VKRRILQVIVGAGAGDAITSMALHLQPMLQTLGESAVYAHHIEPDVAARVLPLWQLPDERRGDVVIYHASYGVPEITRTLLRRRRIVLVYHNITPSGFFLDHSPTVATELEWGRHELTLLRGRTALAVAVSDYNARDLESLGFTDVRTVPAGLNPSRLMSVAPNGRLATELGRRYPQGYVLSVSQVLPHKRHDLLVQAMSLVQWAHERELGVVIVGPKRIESSWNGLHELVGRLRVNGVWFTGAQPEVSLATFFRLARLFVSTSAHEGLALPPLEAMSFGVPVVAVDAGAVRDTIGGAALVLPGTAGPALVAEGIVEADRNEPLRRELSRRGFARVRQIEAANPSQDLLEMLAEL
jgi:glycosyltransferase involved in cell wall biosynthesis